MMRKEEVEEQMKFVSVVFRVSLNRYFFLSFSWIEQQSAMLLFSYIVSGDERLPLLLTLGQAQLQV